MHIEEIAPADAPVPLLLEADPSWKKVQGYLPQSRCFAAKVNGEIVGCAVLLPLGQGTYELMNISVLTAQQKRGIGSALLRQVIEVARKEGVHRLEVGTGSFGYQLAFYQKVGFRVFAVDRDFFLRNYETAIFEDGIQLKDMLRLGMEL